METATNAPGLDLEKLEALDGADYEMAVVRAAPKLIAAAKERDDFLGQIQAYRAGAEYFEAQKVMERENAANARIAELEKALQPFAEQADYWNGDPDDEPLSTCNDEGECSALSFTLKDLRRAAAVLSQVMLTDRASETLPHDLPAGEQPESQRNT